MMTLRQGPSDLRLRFPSGDDDEICGASTGGFVEFSWWRSGDGEILDGQRPVEELVDVGKRARRSVNGKVEEG